MRAYPPKLRTAGALAAALLLAVLTSAALTTYVPGLPPWLAAAIGAALSLPAWHLLRRRQGSESWLQQTGPAIDQIMIGAAETSHFIDTIKQKVDQDIEAADRIADQSRQSATASDQIAVGIERAAQLAREVRDNSAQGRQTADQGLAHIKAASQDTETAARSLRNLQERAQGIHGITAAIDEIAASTNLLALNAAIEAARAGAHGAGFAVVATEVRRLAQRTQQETERIGGMLGTINEEAEQAVRDMSALSGSVEQAAQQIVQVHALLAAIDEHASISGSEIDTIAAASREHVGTASAITTAIDDVHDRMQGTDASLPHATDSAMRLAERAEQLFEMIALSGVQTRHDAIRRIAADAAHAVGKLFEQAIASGQISREALFDRQYQPIPDTRPPKYRTRFDSFTDQVLPSVQEPILSAMPEISYAGAVDDQGYFPTHNRRYSQPLSGDYATDLVNNRTKRLFQDRTGSRCGAHTRPFLLQTYKRDTGEVMHDLSVPIYVEGRHWGGFRIGYLSVRPPVEQAGDTRPDNRR